MFKGRSLSRGLSVQGGLCLGVSGYRVLCQGDPPAQLHAGGMLPTGIHSC